MSKIYSKQLRREVTDMAILENLCRMDLSIENIFARKDIWEKGTEHNYSVSGRNQAGANLFHG